MTLLRAAGQGWKDRLYDFFTTAGLAGVGMQEMPLASGLRGLQSFGGSETRQKLGVGLAKDSPTHHPHASLPKESDMIVAGYVANLLGARSFHTEKTSSRKLDMDFLQNVGAVDHLPKWRKMAEAALTQEIRLVG